MSTRDEKDDLGPCSIDGNVYWGIHTQRALENFGDVLRRVPLSLIHALVTVKKAAVLTNAELGYLQSDVTSALVAACDEILAGTWDDQFPLDALQGGAGTSTNMNVNEVIANRAIEILGGSKGDYDRAHPIDDVNRHQSTNDVYPTALKIAASVGIRQLAEEITSLQGVLQRKEKEFASIVKMARTEWQEAVPITLGSEFAAFAEAIARDRWRIFKCEERLRVVNLGGTAVGTGLGAPRRYIFLVIEKLRLLTGLGLSRAENCMGETANADTYLEVSGFLKTHAANLMKMCNDIRLLAALKEIVLPKVQTGSSIMPGKSNPVILEAVIQIALQTQGNDFLVEQAVSRGTLQINEFLPLIASALLESIELLTKANTMLAKFLSALAENAAGCESTVASSRQIITAFVPLLGYQHCERLLTEFQGQGHSDFKKFLEQRIGKQSVDTILSPENLMSLGYKEDTHENNT